MKMKTILLMVLSLGLLCGLLTMTPASVAAAENLAANGDLELGNTSGWDIDSAVIEKSVVHSGNYSLKLTSTAAYSGAAYKAIPVRKNATVTVSFWYRYTENPSYGSRYHVYTYQGNNPWGSAYKGADASFVALAGNYDTWQQASYTFNCGDFDSIYLKFCPGGNGSFVCYIDDLVVTAEGGDLPDVAPYLTSFGTKMNRPKDAASNLIKNGGFESTSGAQWNKNTFIKGNLRVVSDATAPQGNKSLYLSGDTATTQYYFPVTVERNTQYVFSAWVKSPRLSSQNNATATFGVMNPQTGGFLVYAPYNGNGKGSGSLSTTKMQLMATAPDDEWHLRSVTFDSGSQTTLYIAVYGVGSQLYLDDIALYKLSNGMEYISPLRTEAIAKQENTDNKYCADEDSLIKGIYMTTEEAQQSWSDNPAWRNGFLSFTDAKDNHGTVLQYTASAHPEWKLHYVDWIDVTPNTAYTLTLDVKRLSVGEGKIVLLDDKANAPYEFYRIQFNEVDKNWVTYSITFDSNVYSRIGFAIVDGGGSALIDNVRLFESSKGISTKPTEDIPTLHPENVGTSVMEMEDSATLGVAFLFEQTGNRIYAGGGYRVNLVSATVMPFGDSRAYSLVRMGAIVTNDGDVGTDAERMVADAVNGTTVVDVPVQYLWSTSSTACQYAIRVVNVPPDRPDVLIYVRPYYVFQKDGQEIVVYGDVVSRSYNG